MRLIQSYRSTVTVIILITIIATCSVRAGPSSPSPKDDAEVCPESGCAPLRSQENEHDTHNENQGNANYPRPPVVMPDIPTTTVDPIAGNKPTNRPGHNPSSTVPTVGKRPRHPDSGRNANAPPRHYPVRPPKRHDNKHHIPPPEHCSHHHPPPPPPPPHQRHRDHDHRDHGHRHHRPHTPKHKNQPSQQPQGSKN